MPRTLVSVCVRGAHLAATAITFHLTAPAVAGVASIPALDRGWIRSNGQTNTDGNYITGSAEGVEYRSWFVFEIPLGAAYQVTSAALRLDSALIASVTPWNPEPISFGAVSTPIATLLGRGGGASVFQDLAAGTPFGQRGYRDELDRNQIRDVPLNSDAVAAINAVLGGQIAIGGHAPDIWWPFNEYAFGATTHQFFVHIVLEYAPIPAPASLALPAAGVLVCSRLRVRPTAARFPRLRMNHPKACWAMRVGTGRSTTR